MARSRANSSSGVGFVFGIGAVVGAVVLFLRPRASIAPRGPSPERPGSFPPLVERWRHEIARREIVLPIDAILEWIRIESGGDMCAVGGPNELGIFQLSFPDDAKYGASIEGLRAICAKSKQQKPSDISWMTEDDLDMAVGAGIRKILAARDAVRRVLGASGIHWPEASFDFGSAVKQIHAAPAVISELVPKIARRSGPPASWHDLRQKVVSFPVEQMGPGLQRLAKAPSRHGLANRLEDTLRNAEFVGRAWEASTRDRGSYA